MGGMSLRLQKEVAAIERIKVFRSGFSSGSSNRDISLDSPPPPRPPRPPPSSSSSSSSSSGGGGGGKLASSL